MKLIATIIALLCLGLLTGCSGENGGDGDHVWKEQTDTIERAKQAEEKIMQKAEEQRRAIDNIDQ